MILVFLVWMMGLQAGDYEEGVASIAAPVREKKLNEALQNFLLERNYGAAADALFNLEYYPLAIWMDALAIHTHPWNQQARKNWEEALVKLDIQQSINSYIWHQRLFRSSTGLFFFVLASLTYLWAREKGKRAWQKGAFYVALLGIAMAVYDRYITPPYGVMIYSSSLYQQENLHASLADTNPLPAGLLIRLLDVDEKGEWAKIQTVEGKIGYILADHLRFVIE